MPVIRFCLARHFRVAAAIAVTALIVAACGPHAGSLPPHGAATSTPAASGTLLPTATVSAALAAAGTFYATLPHTNLDSDLQALANNMVASGQYTSAAVSPGGITAKLPDGELALVFADAPEDVGKVTSSAARSEAVRRPSYQNSFTGAPAAHSYVFLFDDADSAFRSDIDSLWGKAMQSSAFTNSAQQAVANYSASALSASLANMQGFGAQGYALDYLSISTHGMIANVALQNASIPQYQYYLQSTSPISLRDQFANDVASQRVAASLALVNNGPPIPGLAFTPAWLVSNMEFNPGAVINLASCLGANTLVLGDNGTVFLNAKIGRWFGWTKEVGIADDYETWSFALDRLLGEQDAANDSMTQVATQRQPPQRPFSLDDIFAIMQTETRSSPLIATPRNETYTVSDIGQPSNLLYPPASDGTAARLIETDFGYENLAGAPYIYALPSVGSMSVAETPANGTLTIAGRFPPDEGSVSIADGTGQHPLAVTSWTTTQILATIPASGAGSAGLVQVFSAASQAGIASNLAPLTQWSGTITYQENDSLTNLGGVDGTGTGSVAAKFNLTFRSDVHPTVPQIDTTPAPQNLWFGNVEGGVSTASVTASQGNFTSSQGTPPPDTATISLSQVATLTPQALPLTQGTFIVGAYANQPSPCNNGLPGPVNDQTTIFCPAFGFFPPFVGLCTENPDGSGLCGSNSIFSPVGSFGAPTLTDPGIVTFTMDPSSYQITVNGADTTFTRPFNNDGRWPADAAVSGTVSAPLYAPTSTTPASRRRGSPSAST